MGTQLQGWVWRGVGRERSKTKGVGLQGEWVWNRGLQESGLEEWNKLPWE